MCFFNGLACSPAAFVDDIDADFISKFDIVGMYVDRWLELTAFVSIIKKAKLEA